MHFLPFLIDRPFWMSEIHLRWHFRSIRILIFFFNFWQNGRRRPFWIPENHFRSHFWPFQIDVQLFFFEIFDIKAAVHFGCPKLTFEQLYFFLENLKFFYKVAAVGHFGCPKIFDRISDHSSIRNYIFFGNFWQNGLSAILDVRNSLSIAFMAILDQYIYMEYFF